SSPALPFVDRNNKSWSPPPRNFLKLNVDAHLTDDGHWGFGLLLRRDDGRCVGAATRLCKGSKDVDLAEAKGLHEAITMITELRLTRVIIELDAAKIVSAVKKKVFPRNQWGMLTQRCARALD
ncbi:hypothetical protein A2U01_0060729, partial [Trifolium medium]|nr:hypothetical protein [Trifolium medium]